MMTMNDLKEYVDFNREFLMAVQDAKKAGKSVDDVAKSWTMPAKYTGYAKADPVRLKSNVQVIFDELKASGRHPWSLARGPSHHHAKDQAPRAPRTKDGPCQFEREDSHDNTSRSAEIRAARRPCGRFGAIA